jgi:CBS domain containing-hemolysin-like protein
MLLAVPFRLVHFALRPLVALMTLFAQSLLRWSGGKRFTGRLFGSRDELRVLMQESAQGLTSEERTMINHVLDLQNLTVGQIAIPLSKTITVSTQTPVSELFSLYRERGFNRLPVWRMEAGRQRIIGFVSLRSLVFAEDVDANKTAGDYLKPALFLDMEMRLELALRQMQRTGQRLAIVLGRDRAEIGVISLQDILQVIFGEVRL